MMWFTCILVVLIMLLPFVAIRSEDLGTYFYWVVVTTAFLIYTAIDTKRWENE